MPTTNRGRAKSRAGSAIRIVRAIGFLAAALLLYLEATTAAVVVIAVVLVGGALMSGRLDKQARRKRQRVFEEWAQRRGLSADPEPVEEPNPFVLFQEQSLKITRAATATSEDARLTLLEWRYATGSSSGRSVRCTGLLLRTGSTGSHLLLRPAGKVRLPRIPGTAPRHETGFAAVDEAFEITLEDEREPDWIDANVAEALEAFARYNASIEISGRTVVVKCLQLDPEQWDGLLTDGERLVSAMHRATNF